MIQRRSIVVDGRKISYFEQGSLSHDAASLVLLHGLTATAETYLPMMERFGGERHVIAVDMPGTEFSEPLADDDASLGAMARTVALVIERLGLQRPVVLGHSHGGAVGLQLAANDPKSIRGLVLMSPAHPFDDHADGLIWFYLTPPGRIFAYALPWLPRWVQFAGFRYVSGRRGGTYERQLEPYRANLQAPGTVDHLLKLLGTWRKDFKQLGQTLEVGLRVPVLVLWGECDPAVPVKTAEALCARLGDTRLVVLAGVGHRPAEEAPGLCAREVEGWLASRDFGERRAMSDEPGGKA
jgi:pimeloyl-ACP methyl ester carboxylesterase